MHVIIPKIFIQREPLLLLLLLLLIFSHTAKYVYYKKRVIVFQMSIVGNLEKRPSLYKLLYALSAAHHNYVIRTTIKESYSGEIK